MAALTAVHFRQRSRATSAALILAGLLAATPAWGGVWKCTVDGAVVFTDKPCPTAGAEIAADELKPNVIDPVRIYSPPERLPSSRGPYVERGPGGSGFSYGSGKRSQAAIAAFKRANPCPATGRQSGSCPGYDIDHRVPLAAGGADHPSNMQWLTVSAHREKTSRERRSCTYGCAPR